MKPLLLATFLLLLSVNTFSQPEKWKSKKHFTVVSYNIENLFDTINTPGKSDFEFTPKEVKKWNTEKYYNKLEKISFVLSEINKSELPELIGLIEVENDLVLADLVKTEKLKDGNYSYIIEDGPDPRGIDCGLLYRPDAFKYISHSAIPVAFPFAKNKRTRDILYVKGLVNKDTVHVFVNHWSSRRGGQEKSEPKRNQSATVLKIVVDSIMETNSLANIVIMGDFNDEPSNTSVSTILDAGKVNEGKMLTNLIYEKHLNGEGTYYYRGQYNMLDHLIINSKISDKGFRIIKPEAYIFKPDTICYTNKNGDKSPAKTYGGKNYYGGFSDHFPIYTFFYEK